MAAPRVAFGGGGGGGSSYDDTALAARVTTAEGNITTNTTNIATNTTNATALAARVTALEASIIWNLNAAAAGSDAGPSTSVLISSLSSTKRSLIRVKWTQSGANNTTGIDFKPGNNASSEGDASWYRASNAGTFGEDTAKSVIAHVILNTALVDIDIYIDPVAKTGWALANSGAGSTPGSSNRSEHTFLQWTTAAITSVGLAQLGASATMTTTSWKVWTET